MDEARRTVSRFFRFLGRRWWVLLLVTGGLGYAVYKYAGTLPRTYGCSPVVIELVLDPPANSQSLESYEYASSTLAYTVVPTQQAVLSTSGVLDPVVQELHLENDPDYASLAGHVVTTASDRTSLIYLTVQGPNPATNAAVANAVARTYGKLRKEEREKFLNGLARRRREAGRESAHGPEGRGAGRAAVAGEEPGRQHRGGRGHRACPGGQYLRRGQVRGKRARQGHRGRGADPRRREGRARRQRGRRRPRQSRRAQRARRAAPPRSAGRAARAEAPAGFDRAGAAARAQPSGRPGEDRDEPHEGARRGPEGGGHHRAQARRDPPGPVPGRGDVPRARHQPGGRGRRPREGPGAGATRPRTRRSSSRASTAT